MCQIQSEHECLREMLRNCTLNYIYVHFSGCAVVESITERSLSYDVHFIQWITRCHKDRMTTRAITLLQVYVTSLTTSMSTTCFLIKVMFILKAIKPILAGHMINRNLQSWSFHMKLMKLAEGSFHKFHVK